MCHFLDDKTNDVSLSCLDFDNGRDGWKIKPRSFFKKKKNQILTFIYLKTHDAFNYTFNNLSTQYTFISIKNIKLNIKKITTDPDKLFPS